jgi:4-hydroxybenzoate polyprenyltransferase
MDTHGASNNDRSNRLLIVGNRLPHYIKLTRLDRPIGIFLLLWPTLWALWIASDGLPDLRILFVFVVGVILMRSAGCAINDYSDRRFDAHVQRTRSRPLASGLIGEREALLVFVLLASVAFLLVLQLNLLTIKMSFVGIFLAVVYPLMKRYTHWPQAVLGAAFAWAVPMVFAAIRNEVPAMAWLLFFNTVLWTMAYDTMYAMVDRDDDLRIGVKSTAVLFGNADRAIVALLQLAVLAGMVVIGYTLHYSIYYYLGLAVATGFAVYQQILIRHRDRDKCFRAFLNNNWFGAAVFAGIVVHYGFWHG